MIDSKLVITLEKLAPPRRFFKGKTILGKTIKSANHLNLCFKSFAFLHAFDSLDSTPDFQTS